MNQLPVRFVLCALMFMPGVVQASSAPEVDFSKMPVSELIDSLTSIDASAPGINSAAIYGGFIAQDDASELQMGVGVLGVPGPTIPPQMRELVRRGVAALPALIDHLNDARPTKLIVGNQPAAPGQKDMVGVNFFMFEMLGDEYEPRVIPKKRVSHKETPFEGSYTVKVGDVCYVLIGQIVNRPLLAVRYQPSAGLVVNSPVVTLDLVERVKSDWGGTNDEALKASLLADLRAAKRPYQCASALVRLRLYYPAAYQRLTGGDLRKRDQFELQEKQKQ